ncbi:MAG TPA: response regulator transcription factor [Acidimicrobiales bacterium]|nr:response regulator transcription factor [Acidimicrobiales bacterium]
MTDGIVIVDDHTLIAEALALALRGSDLPSVAVVPPSGDDAALLERIGERRPALVLLDIHLDGDRVGIPLIAPLLEQGLSVIVLTASRDPILLAACIRAGAQGLVDKAQPFAELASMIRSALEGAPVLSMTLRAALLERADSDERLRARRDAPFRALTPREAEVLASLMRGLAAEAISLEIGTTVATVRTHVRALLSKLNVNTQLAAVAAAYAAQWQPPEG